MAAAKKVDKATNSTEAPITEKVKTFAHEAVDQASESVGNAEESIRATAADTAETIAEKKETAALQVSTLADQARLMVVENPLTAAAAAFTAGLIVTSLLSKRS